MRGFYDSSTNRNSLSVKEDKYSARLRSLFSDPIWHIFSSGFALAFSSGQRRTCSRGVLLRAKVGPNGISMKMPRANADVGFEIIFAVWKACGSVKGTSRARLKETLIPIVKKGAPHSAANYRLIVEPIPKNRGRSPKLQTVASASPSRDLHCGAEGASRARRSRTCSRLVPMRQ